MNNGLSSLSPPPQGEEDARAQAIELCERILQPAFLAYARAEQAKGRHPYDIAWAMSRAFGHAVAGFAHDAARSGGENAQSEAATKAWIDWMTREVHQHAHEAIASPGDCPGCRRASTMELKR